MAEPISPSTISPFRIGIAGGDEGRALGLLRSAAGARVPMLTSQDAADGVPPFLRFWRHTRDAGADAVVISGGKGLRGA